MLDILLDSGPAASDHPTDTAGHLVPYTADQDTHPDPAAAGRNTPSAAATDAAAAALQRVAAESAAAADADSGYEAHPDVPYAVMDSSG